MQGKVEIKVAPRNTRVSPGNTKGLTWKPGWFSFSGCSCQGGKFQSCRGQSRELLSPLHDPQNLRSFAFQKILHSLSSSNFWPPSPELHLQILLSSRSNFIVVGRSLVPMTMVGDADSLISLVSLVDNLLRSNHLEYLASLS